VCSGHKLRNGPGKGIPFSGPFLFLCFWPFQMLSLPFLSATGENFYVISRACRKKVGNVWCLE